MVFAGYGLSVPGRTGEGYDSFAGLDVKDKIVLVFRYVPEGVEPKRRAELNRYAGLRYKAMIARSHGAKALLVVTGPNSPNAGQLAPDVDFDLVGSGIGASMSGKVAEALLAARGKTNSAQPLRPENRAYVRFQTAEARTRGQVERIRKTDRNVIALLPPGTTAAGLSTEYVSSAHYDHVGRGETGGFGIKGEEGQIHNGAETTRRRGGGRTAAALVSDRQKPNDSSRAASFSPSGPELG